MSTLKKILALTLALAMVMSLGVFAAFKDQATIDEDCADAVVLMNALGIILGDNNGNANPTKTITRAEAATMIFRLMNKGKDDATIYEGGKYFTDVPSGAWFEGYVNYAYTMGIIAGRTATTFDPYAPVTGYEIAKMLLGCLKYRQEIEGYTGTMWAANVQNDAFAAGLLDDYGMSLSSPAQRQWVAVMFQAALYADIVKYDDGEAVSAGTTMANKNFGLNITKGVLMGAGNVSLTSSYTPDSDDPDDYCYVTGDDLGTLEFTANADLLGQQVKVIYKLDKNGDMDKVYSIVSSGKSKVGNTTVDAITYSSSSGKYTFGSLTGKVDADLVVFTNKYDPDEDTIFIKAYTGSSADNMLDSRRGKNINEPVRAIDVDADGDIDYLICDGTYEFITLTSTPTYSSSKETWNINGTTYDEDLVSGVEDLVKGDFVKVTANVAKQVLELEAVTPVTSAVLSRQSANVSYTLGGTTYKAAYNTTIGSLTLGKEYAIYTDGKFAQKIGEPSQTATALPAMCMVTALGVSTDTYGSKANMVKVLTLDGKVTEYEYDDNDVSGALPVETVFNKDGGGAYTNKGVVYAYGVNSDGTIYFKTVTTSILPDHYSIVNNKVNSYSASKNLIGSYKIAADTKLFVQTSAGKYKVLTLADLGYTIDSNILFVYTQTGKVGQVAGGKVVLTSTSSGTISSTKYAVITDIYEQWNADDEDTDDMVEMILQDGSVVNMVYKTSLGTFEIGGIYDYTITDDVATFTAFTGDNEELTAIDGNYLSFGDETTLVASSNVVVVVDFGDGDGAVISSLDKAYDEDMTNTASYVTDSDSGEVTMLYVVQTDLP